MNPAVVFLQPSVDHVLSALRLEQAQGVGHGDLGAESETQRMVVHGLPFYLEVGGTIANYILFLYKSQ